MNKKAGLTTSTIILVAVFLIGLYFGFKTFNQRDDIYLLEQENSELKTQIEELTSQETLEKLKSCPDELIINEMPQVDSENSTNYFIFNGERTEISEFDLSWIIQNCEINKTIVS